MLRVYLKILFFNIKKQKKIFILLLFTIFTNIHNQGNIEGSFPKTLLLQNGNIFLANNKGMYIYDKKLETQIKSYSYSNDISSNIYTIISKILIAQFPETDGMIICLVNNTIYFFNSTGDNLFSDSLPEHEYSYFNLLTYKKENNYNHYLIAFIINNDYSYELNILHYQANNTNNKLIYRKTFKPFYFDYPKIKIKKSVLGCQIMNSKNKGKVVTCCFQTQDYDFIVIQSFIIENNLEEIGEDVYAKIETQNSEVIHSLVSQDEKRLLSCYYEDSRGYCLTYDIDSNTIVTNEPLIEKCKNIYYQFNLFYVKKTNEYAFICSDDNQKFTIMLMNEAFNIINKDSYSTYNFELKNSFNTYNLMYDEEKNQYAFIIDELNNGIFTTKINYINTDFNNSFPAKSSKPNPYTINPPPTEIINLNTNNKYYLNIIENYKITSTISDKNGIIIDFLDKNKPIFLTKENKTINASLYALHLDINGLEGKLRYIINNEEIVVSSSNEKKFGYFKLKYYPPDKYEIKDKFNFRVFLRNYSIASDNRDFEIEICKENCTCIGQSNCIGCVNGYSFKENKCFAICKNRFYINNETENLTCLEEEINECPYDYPIYNNYSKECKQIEIDNSNYFEELLDSSTQEKSQFESIIISQTDTQQFTDKSTTILNIKENNPSQDNILSDFNINFQTHIQQFINKSTIILNSEEDNLTQNSNMYINFKSSIPNIQSAKSEIISSQNPITDINEIYKQSDENQNSYIESYKLTISSIIITDTNEFNERSNTDKISSSINNIYDYYITNLEKSENINQPNKTYSILSSMIKNGNLSISQDEKDIILRGNDVVYQITNTENQKNANQSSDLSIIDLGECEKIIKRNISYEDDPTPLIILKIDIKKEDIKSSLVAYEVYNPYTKEKINLNICSNVKITIISPVNLTSEETSLYNDLNNQGYDLYNSNDSFYQDICTQYTSKNGTDVILIDRKNYFYDENATFCENSCSYEGINTEDKKVYCYCDVKDDSMDFDSHNFNKEKFLENFYKVEDYTNYQVLFCYKLVFSSKGLKNNICFYVFIILFILFLSSMIVNLLKALKKIDEIIFKIFQDKFMFQIMKNIIMNKKNKKLEEKNEETNENSNKKDEVPASAVETTKKLSFFQKLALKYKNPKSNNNNKDNNDKSNSSLNKSNNNKNIFKMKNQKIINPNIHKRNNMKFRMSCKVDYSNNIRDKNFQIPNLFDAIQNKENKNSSLIFENNNNDIQNNLNSNDNTIKISNNIIDINSSNKNFKKYSRRKIGLNKIIPNNKSKLNRNIRKSCNIIYFNRFKNNMNKPNPPLKKNNAYLNIINKKNNIQQNIHSSSNSPEKYTLSKDIGSIIKGPLKRKSYKIFNRPNDLITNNQRNSLISNNLALISIKNEDTYSKNQLLQKSSPIIDFKKINKEKDNILQIEKPPIEKKQNKNVKFIDAELNKMDYENALIYDKRKYCQYYVSLLKKKHLIILVFISNDDYNVFLLKFSLFIVSISLFFALNTLFFRDSTMRYIFTNEGKYDLLYQIPQVLYSTIISFVMTYILKILSLSQMAIIEIKKEQDKTKAKKIAEFSKKCLKIKFYFFFFIGLFLIIFCWYYLTAFGAVYPNTQLHLIKDTLISFGISMIYPFIINIIPGFFRIPALKAEHKDKKCLYIISKIIAFF